jgi:hypothetical protein
VVGADIPHADVVTHDDDDVWFFRLVCFLLRISNIRERGYGQREDGGPAPFQEDT